MEYVFVGADMDYSSSRLDYYNNNKIQQAQQCGGISDDSLYFMGIIRHGFNLRCVYFELKNSLWRKNPKAVFLVNCEK